MSHPVRVKTSEGWQDLALTGPQGPKGDTGPQGAQGIQGPVGISILEGAGPPDPSVGTVGQYYNDTLNGVLFGPKLAGTYETAQIPTMTGGPNGTTSNIEYGELWNFLRPGRITAVRYQRHSASAATMTFRVWSPEKVKLAEWSDTRVGAGAFETTLPTPVNILPGPHTLSTGMATANTIAYGSPSGLASTADVVFLDYVVSSGAGTFGQFPGSSSLLSTFLAPVFEPNPTWPITVRTDPDLAQIAGLFPKADNFIQRKGGVWTAITQADVITQFPATSITPGMVQLASTANVVTGTAIDRATTPASLTGAGITRRSIKADATTAYAPVVGDENKLVTLSNAAAITVTMPSNATAAFPIGAEVEFLWLGVGQPTFVAGSGAIVNATPGLKLRAQYSRAVAKKINTNDWILYGDLSA